MSEEVQRTESPDVERGIGATWESLAPLSVGAVTTSTALILSSVALRRLLGGRGRILSWIGGGALLSIGAWLLARSVEEAPGENSEGGGAARSALGPDAEEAAVPSEAERRPNEVSNG